MGHQIRDTEGLEPPGPEEARKAVISVLPDVAREELPRDPRRRHERKMKAANENTAKGPDRA